MSELQKLEKIGFKNFEATKTLLGLMGLAWDWAHFKAVIFGYKHAKFGEDIFLLDRDIGDFVRQVWVWYRWKSYR